MTNEERLARVEARLDTAVADIAVVRNRTHNLANDVHGLTVLFQDSDGDMKALVDSQKALTDKLERWITELSVMAASFSAHQRQCIDQRIEDRVISERYHQENQVRLKRLEMVYYIGIAVIMVVSFFGIGERLFFNLIGKGP